jgi:hypothetical protein
MFLQKQSESRKVSKLKRIGQVKEQDMIIMAKYDCDGETSSLQGVK